VVRAAWFSVTIRISGLLERYIEAAFSFFLNIPRILSSENPPVWTRERALRGKPKMFGFLLIPLPIKALATEVLKLPLVGVTVPLTIAEPSATLSIVTASILVVFYPRVPKRPETNVSIFGRKAEGVVSRVKAN
jgi:hypothetical protein